MQTHKNCLLVYCFWFFFFFYKKSPFLSVLTYIWIYLVTTTISQSTNDQNQMFNPTVATFSHPDIWSRVFNFSCLNSLKTLLSSRSVPLTLLQLIKDWLCKRLSLLGEHLEISNMAKTDQIMGLMFNSNVFYLLFSVFRHNYQTDLI